MSSWLDRLSKGEGWILYCPDCKQYVSQSDPQDDSRRKTVIIDDESCEKCKAKEVQEAQQICGRLGIAESKPLPPKEDTTKMETK